MHVQCHDITYDVTALINDVMSENKMTRFGRGTSQGAFSENCLKTAVELENLGNGTPELLGILRNATYVWHKIIYKCHTRVI